MPKRTEFIVRHGMIVSGRVQAVGFRKYVLAYASELKLAGFCRNLPSGEVEVEAEGSPEKIEQLFRLLQVGPPRGQVEKVTLSAALPLQFESAFEIRY